MHATNATLIESVEQLLGQVLHENLGIGTEKTQKKKMWRKKKEPLGNLLKQWTGKKTKDQVFQDQTILLLSI